MLNCDDTCTRVTREWVETTTQLDREQVEWAKVTTQIDASQAEELARLSADVRNLQREQWVWAAFFILVFFVLAALDSRSPR